MMKLIKKWRDKKYKVDNYLYENKDGLRVLHTLNTTTLDTYASLLIKAGTYYEKDLGVPDGTAHFLEHMLNNGNKDKKSFVELKEANLGNKSKPELITNMYTSYKYVDIIGFCNSLRETDLIKYIFNVIDYPIKRFPEYIEKDRKIIKAEMQQDYKPHLDPWLNFVNFALGRYTHNNNFSILGKNEEDLDKITVSDLEKMFLSQYKIENSILSIQSSTKLSKTILKYIDLISNSLSKNSLESAQIVPEKSDLEYEVGYFNNKNINGTNIYVYNFFEVVPKRDYLKDRMEAMSISLLEYLGFNEIREKEHTIYSIKWSWLNSLTFKNVIGGLDMSLTHENITKALDELYDLMYNKVVGFLNTKQGTRWFFNESSRFIFPHTQSYQEDYSERKAIYVLNDQEILDFNKAKIATLNISKTMLQDYLKEKILNIKWKFWFESSQKTSEVEKSFKKSLFFKKFNR